MNFKVRQYVRTELAILYSPNISGEAAWRKLKLWIATYPGLQDHLFQLGYNGNRRCFTPSQVEAIVAALGEP